MRLVNNHHDLAFQAVLGIVIPVFDDLVIDILQYQQHLRIRNSIIAVGKQGLEIKDGKVFFCGNGRLSVPNGCISAARREFCNIIHQHPQIRADVIVVCLLELCQNCIIQIVKNRVILRTQPGKVRIRCDPLVDVHTIHQRVQILQGILIAIRQNLTEELLQKLQMRCITVCGFSACLIIVQRGNDVEGI